MSAWTVVAVTVLLVVLSALFVAAEFALLVVKRHRLQDAAGTSRSARAPLRSFDELTVLLAGAVIGMLTWPALLMSLGTYAERLHGTGAVEYRRVAIGGVIAVAVAGYAAQVPAFVGLTRLLLSDGFEPLTLTQSLGLVANITESEPATVSTRAVGSEPVTGGCGSGRSRSGPPRPRRRPGAAPG